MYLIELLQFLNLKMYLFYPGQEKIILKKQILERKTQLVP